MLINFEDFFIGRKNVKETESDAEYTHEDFLTRFGQFMKKAITSKRFKVEQGEYINNFEVFFTAEGEAIRVEIKTTKKVDPKAEQVKGLEAELRKWIAMRNYIMVEAIAKKIAELKGQQ